MPLLSRSPWSRSRVPHPWFSRVGLSAVFPNSHIPSLAAIVRTCGHISSYVRAQQCCAPTCPASNSYRVPIFPSFNSQPIRTVPINNAIDSTNISCYSAPVSCHPLSNPSPTPPLTHSRNPRLSNHFPIPKTAHFRNPRKTNTLAHSSQNIGVYGVSSQNGKRGKNYFEGAGEEIGCFAPSKSTKTWFNFARICPRSCAFVM